ncbi:MAG: formylglycine-generating enzyme family protein [Lentisphaerae bacterium]|nr:formylglycine-generating enzyme family protein [Lentisphaerota bacterium]
MKNKKIIYLLFSVWILCFPICLHANNLKVENVDICARNEGTKQMMIEFDLSWENSWKNELNHDAAWVFAKFRPVGSDVWEHAFLSLVPSHHSALNGKIEVGSSIVSGTERGMGVFVSSSSAWTGNVAYVRSQLLWDYGASGYDFQYNDIISVSVQAIEMVYVAEGSFYLGSGGTEGSSFTDGAWPGAGGTIPFAITSESALTLADEPGCLWATGHIEPGEVPSKFPKGFNAFYCMKYEISQGQYAAFLNLLTPAEAAARYPGTYNETRFLINRITDPGEKVTYVAEAPDRACNFIYWPHGLRYAAWSGLRPMSELEFEKACRGPSMPVPNENAWGNTNTSLAKNIVGVDGSGTEYYAIGNVNFSYQYQSLGGPARVGVFARESNDRFDSGASYWGILDLSGSLFERSVWAYGLGVIFEGTHGAGDLITPPDWPEPNGNHSAVFARGGSFRHSDVKISTRSQEVYPHGGRNGYYGEGGFRCVRTAP